VKGGPLVVVGDTLLDIDVEGTAQRLSPDAPVPVVQCRQERHRAGGAGLAAVLGAELAGSPVILVTALGHDASGQRLRGILDRHVQVLATPLRGSTSCKIRVRAGGQSVVRLDTGDGRAARGRIESPIEQALEQAGAILVCDYGRGMTAHPGLTALLRRLGRETPVIWDPHPAGERPVAGTRLATPNRAEARTFAAGLGPTGRATSAAGEGGTAPPVAGAAADARTLATAWGTAVAVTMGGDGALLSVGEAVPIMVPTAPAAPAGPADSCGAGDCFAAAAAHVLRAGGMLTDAVTKAVRCASEFVGRGGAAAAPSVTFPAPPSGPPAPASGAPGPMRPRGGTAGDTGTPWDAEMAWEVVTATRARGGRIVATGGCFDLLHAGHVQMLRQARRLGDCLVVCLNSDSSARALKGPGHPLVAGQDRARVVAALECVDAVLIFDQPTPSTLLERLRPDVWVKGGDYAGAELAEADVVSRHGGQVVLLPYVDRHSTSRLVAAASRIGAYGALSGGRE
jgi:D-beta-D-heptose 7-phosphate kinase / D-beta-D-heptose 1-phosphate adenosyltransferase